MSKKRAIVSYDKLTTEQKREINRTFPDGFGTNMTTIKTPTGETLDALIWETEDVIYLVKIVKNMTASLDDEEEDEEEDDIDDVIKPDDLEEEDEEDDLPKKSKKNDHDDDDDDDDEEEEDED